MIPIIHIDDTFDTWRKKCNRILELIGDIDAAEFLQDGIDTFVDVLNWMYNKVKNFQKQIGDITLLQTNDKSSVVNAINEVVTNQRGASLRYAIIIG